MASPMTSSARSSTFLKRMHALPMSSFLPVLAQASRNHFAWSRLPVNTHQVQRTCNSSATPGQRTGAAASGRSGSRPGTRGAARSSRSSRTECLPRNPLSRFARITLRTASIAFRRSSGNSARYCSTVVALLCMGRPSQSHPDRTDETGLPERTERAESWTFRPVWIGQHEEHNPSLIRLPGPFSWGPRGCPSRSRIPPSGPPQQGVYVRPERLPLLPLGIDESGEEVASRTLDRSASTFQCWSVWATRSRAFGSPRPAASPTHRAGLELAKGLATKLRLRRVFGRRPSLPCSGGGECGGAGGVVAVPGPAVVAELGARPATLGPEPGGGGVPFRS